MTSIHQRIATRKQLALNRVFGDVKSPPIRVSHRQHVTRFAASQDKRWMMIVFTLLFVELGLIIAYGATY